MLLASPLTRSFDFPSMYGKQLLVSGLSINLII
jgi:hypothetical protein